MTEKTIYGKSTIEAIKQRIKVLNGIVLLVVYVMLLLISRFIYDFLNYVPLRSLIIIISLVAGLMLLSLYLSSFISRKAIKTINEYGDKLGTILMETKTIQETVHTDILFDRIIDISMNITGAHAGSVLVEEGDRLTFRVVKGAEKKMLTGFSIPKSQGIAGWVFENAAPLRIAEARKDGRFYPEVDKVTGYETQSILCAPMRLKKGTIGVIELVNKAGGPFTSEDEDLLSYFADEAAVSIEKASFYEKEKNYEIHLTDILVNIVGFVPEKRGHSKRIAKFTLLMADKLNMPEKDKERLYRASLLHDIGFLRINMDEDITMEKYRQHPTIGYEMLKPIDFYSDIAEHVLYHHERHDGRGYPAGLKGEAIPLISRMIAVAEAFDAMVSRKSYKAIGKIIAGGVNPHIVGFGPAVEEIRKNSGTQFDPKLAELFAETITEDHLEE